MKRNEREHISVQLQSRLWLRAYNSEFRGNFVLLSEPAHQNIVTPPIVKFWVF